MKKKSATLYTIGYEGWTPEELLAILSGHGVTRVADVRQMPLSRKPGFSKSALSAFLESHGIEYVGFPRLGVPPAIRKSYNQNGDFARLKRDYLAYLRTQGPEIERLRELAAQGGCALLCFERDPARCHRSILAGVLAGRGGHEFRVVHLGFDEVSPQDDLFAESRPEAGSA